jgi:uncharacterized protein involved in outer membrane biogenesis
MRWRKILIAAALLVVVLVVAAYAFLSFYDFNKFKPMIAQAVKEATGRELTIAGDINIGLSIPPTFLVEDVTFQNAPWSSRPNLAQVKRMEIQIAVLPLILGDFDFIRIVLIEPDVIVEFNSSGTSNFAFDTPGGEEEEETELPVLIFSDVHIEKGLFLYKDAESGLTFAVRLDRLDAGIPGFDKPLKLDFEGAFDDIPLTLEGILGPIIAWIEPGHPLPANLAAGAGGATVNVKGEIQDPINFKGLAFTVTAEGPSIAEIAKLVGVTHVPELGVFRLKADVADPEGKLAVKGLDIHVGSEELAEISLTGAIKDLLAQRGVKLEFAVRGKNLANLKEMGVQALSFQEPFNFSGQLVDPAPKIYKIPALKVVMGDSDASGSVELNLAKQRPKVTAVLSSQKTDLRPLLVKAEEKGTVKGLPAKSDKKRDKVLSSRPWSLDGLNLIDADIKILGKQVLLPRLALDEMTVDILLKNGNLTVEPIKFMIGGGSAYGRFNLRSQDKPSSLDMELKIEQLDLGPMLDELGYQQTLKGTLNADITLAGSGNSLADLMAGLNGRVSIVMMDGQVASKHLKLLQNILGTDVLRLINPFKKKETQTKVNCFINDIDIKDGLAECKLLLDTDQTSIFGAGDVDLRTEKLNLGIKPVPKKGYGLDSVATVGFSFKELSQPFKLGDTLAHPSLVLDPTRSLFMLGKVAGVVALGPFGIAAFFADVSLGKKDPCLEVLEALEKEEKKKADKDLDNSKTGTDKEKGKESDGFFRKLFRRGQ